MTKKITAVLALCLICVLCAVSLTACEDDNGKIIIPDTPTHTHAYTETIVPPTCAEQGYTLHKCECGVEYKTDETAALGHNYEWTTTKEPTETEKGEETGICKNCGDTIIKPISELNHVHNYVDTVIAPTCTEQGYTLHKCACGIEYKTDETATLGHDYKWTIIIEPTATEKGEETGVCTRCNDMITHDIPELNHKHNYVMTEFPSTCTENGYKLYKCACGEEYITIESPILGHNYVSVITAPTCTEQGYTTYACIRCGVNYKEDFTDALGHLYISSTTEPTCTEQGFTTYTCVRCNDTYKGNFVAERGHDYILETTPSTCTEQGQTTYTCSRCSATERQTTPASGHDYLYINNSFNGMNGSARFRCMQCGEIVEAAVDFVAAHAAQDCRSKSYTTYKAELDIGIDGSDPQVVTFNVYADEEIMDHTVKANTAGVQYMKYAGYKVAAAGPNYEYNDQIKSLFAEGLMCWSEGVPDNCERYAPAIFVCAICQEYIVISLSGEHNYVNGSCTVCGKTHSHNYVATVVAPTCTASGYTLYKCSCGDEYKSNYTSALGHNFVDDVCARCGTNLFAFTLLDDDTYEITVKDKNNSLNEIILPSTYNDKPITCIAKYAFKNCSSLITLIIPDSVTCIGEYAFYGCSNLTSITIPDSVTSIGDSAFQDCSCLQYNKYDNGLYLGNNSNQYVILIRTKPADITTCTINSKTKCIYAGAFSGCSSLTSITIPDSVTSIGSIAFSKCTSLTSITIGNNVTSIGRFAFSYCGSLTSITIPNSVTSMGDYTFQYCRKLKNITISENITRIEKYTFENCDNLKYNEYDNGYYLGNDDNPYLALIKTENTSITSCIIHNSTKIIASYAFESRSKLTSITIPDSVTTIGNSAFYKCSSLTNITIGNNVKSIGGSAFSFCYSLTSITIPDSVTIIGDCAFYGCSLKSITIPDSVTIIGDCAFYGCSLKSITIPDSVEIVFQSAFRGCDNLNGITFNGTKEKWNAILSKPVGMYYSDLPTIVVHCTDGDVAI